MIAQSTTSRGNMAESQALKLLASKGLSLVVRNFRIRSGEIDLIMDDPGETGQNSEDSTLVFVEVRFRNTDDYGTAAESVSRKKIQKIVSTAEYFLIKNPQYQSRACRFDIVAITGQAPPEWIQNAFTLN